MSALVTCAALGACSYDFDALVAQGNPAGTGGAGGSAGEAGSSGAAGDTGTGGAGGSEVDSSGGAGGAAGDTGTGGAGAGGATGTGGAAGTAGKASTDAGSDDAGQGGTGGGFDAGKGGDAGADAPSDRGGTGDARADVAFDCAAVGGIVYQAHCYYPSPTLTSWDVAKNSGCALPSHLVVITTMGEQAVVAGILPGTERWIGLRKDPGPPNNEMAFRWVTGEQLSFKIWDVYDAGAPEPNYTGDCVRMRATNNWGDTGCTETYAAICERE